jgi:hypothetical protein
MEQPSPRLIILGHGDVTTLATAEADAQAYRLALRAQMEAAVVATP